MVDTDKELAAVNVEIISAEDLDGLSVVAKVGDKPDASGSLARAGSALQLASDVLESIPEKGLFKVEVPDGFTLQDLIPAKGDEGAFRAIVKDSKGKMAGQAKLREAGKINPTQIAGAGGVEIDLAAAPARVLGQSIAGPAKLAEILRPKIHAAERVFRAGIFTVFQDFMRPRAIGGLRLVKRDHKKIGTPVCLLKLAP